MSVPCPGRGSSSLKSTGVTHLTLMSPGPPSLSPVVTLGPGTNGHILEGRSVQPSGGAPTAPQGSCETWARPPALALSRDSLSPVGRESERLRAPGWEAVLPLGHVRGAQIVIHPVTRGPGFVVSEHRWRRYGNTESEPHMACCPPSPSF